MLILNDLLDYRGMKIYQDSSMFNFTLDSILLARFAKFKRNDLKIIDFGTNNAVIPLVISNYTKSNIIGLEILKEACDIAKKNVDINNLSNQIEIINQDIKDYCKKNPNIFDYVLCNPPFFKIDNSQTKLKNDQLKSNARHELSINLEQIISNAALVLKNKGTLVIIHIAERLDELIFLLYKKNFCVKTIQFVHSSKGEKASKALIEAKYQGNYGVSILEPMYIHDEITKEYLPEIKELFKV